MTRDAYTIHAELLALSTRLTPYLPREVAATTTATLLRTANAVAEYERELRERRDADAGADEIAEMCERVTRKETVR